MEKFIHRNLNIIMFQYFDRNFLNISPVNVEISVEPEMYFHEDEENDSTIQNENNLQDNNVRITLVISLYLYE